MKEEQGFKYVENVKLVAVPQESWHLLQFPEYQRKPTQQKVRDIAAGLREGYTPAPIILYQTGSSYRIVDGGHRFHAYRLNYEQHGFLADIPALIYDGRTFDQSQTFVLENNKLRMDPTAIIRADDRRCASGLIRELGVTMGSNFNGIENIAEYPVRPLSIVKAALLLHARGYDLDANTLAYLSVNRALDRLEKIVGGKGGEDFWNGVVIPFLNAEIALWGVQGRHLVNFGVLGFALFLGKNRPRFFDKNGNLVIKTTRAHVSEKRGRNYEYEKPDRSDFAKLASLQPRWNKPSDRLYQEASRNPLVVAGQINDHFWKNVNRTARIWRPELSW